MLLFGLQAAAQPVMDRMVKGTRLETIERVLPARNAAGIWNLVFFFGFPGEMLDDAREPANFVNRHGDEIDSPTLGTFVPERYAPALAHPEAFGITRVIDRPAADLGSYSILNTRSKPAWTPSSQSR